RPRKSKVRESRDLLGFPCGISTPLGMIATGCLKPIFRTSSHSDSAVAWKHVVAASAGRCNSGQKRLFVHDPRAIAQFESVPRGETTKGSRYFPATQPG